MSGLNGSHWQSNPDATGKRRRASSSQMSDSPRSEKKAKTGASGSARNLGVCLEAGDGQETIFTEEDQTSILTRSAQKKLAIYPGKTGWLRSVHHQMKYAFDKMRLSQLGRERAADIEDHYNKPNEEMLLEEVTKWLRSHREHPFFHPATSKGTDSKIAAVQASNTVSSYCKEAYGLSIDEYIAKLERDDACPGFELAHFSFTRRFDKARLAVLHPVSMRKSYNQAWDIWDQNNESKPVVGNPILRIACNAENQFMSLVHEDDAEPEAAVPAAAAHDLVDDIRADDDDDGSNLGADTETGHFNRVFGVCRLPECRKRRLFPKRGGQENAAGSEEDEGGYTCSDTGLAMENTCSEPAIYDEIRKFFHGASCITYSRTIDNKLLNLSQLFRVVTAAGGMERLQTEKKLTDLAKLLGARPENATREGQRVKAAFQSVFQQARAPSFRTLEEVLKGQADAMEAVARQKSHVCATLGLSPQGDLDCLSHGQQLPSLFQSTGTKLEQSSDLLEVMKSIAEAGHHWQEYARHSKTPRTWAPVVDAVVETALASTSNGAKTGSLVMVGNTGAGKSFLLDNVLRISECDRSRYPHENQKSALDPSDLDAQQFLRELEADLADVASEASASEQEGSVSSFEMLVADASLLSQYVSEEVEQEAAEAEAMVRNYCTSVEAAKALVFNKIGFLMPSGRIANSTTACSVSIRRSSCYQLVLEYKSEASLLDEWRQYSTIKDSQNKEEKKRVTVMLAQVKQALPDSAFDLEPGQKKVNRVNSDAMKKAKAFLSSVSEQSMSTLELHTVLGKSVGFAGAGASAMHDRILIRALLHNAQGLRDDLTQSISVAPLARGSHPLLDESGDVRVEFGQRTLPALKRITIFGPFVIAPTRESDWVDTAGCGDGDPLKQAVLSQELVKAESVMVLVAKNLNKAPAVCGCLRDSHALRKLVETARAGRVDRGRVSVLCNYEAEWKRDNAPLMWTDMEGPVYDGEEDQDGNDGAVPVSQAKLHGLVMGMLQQPASAAMDDVTAEGIASRVCQSVPVVIPAFMYATSLMMHTDQAQISEAERTERLARTRIFEVFGMIEKFLQAGTVRLIENLELTLEVQLNEIERLKTVLQKTIPASTPGLNQNPKRTEERFCEEVKKGASQERLAEKLKDAMLSAVDNAVLEELDIDVGKILDEAVSQQFEAKHKGQSEDTDSEGSEGEDEEACTAQDPVKCFSDIVHRKLQEELKKPLLEVKKKVLQSVFESSVAILQPFIVSTAQKLLATEMLPGDVEDQIAKMVEKSMTTRRNDQKSRLAHLNARGLDHLATEVPLATKALRDAVAELSPQLTAKLFTTKGRCGGSHGTAFVERCLQAVKSGLQKEMLVRTRKVAHPTPGEDFLGKLGLRKLSLNRANSLRDMGKALVTILQPSDVVGRSKDDLEQLNSLERALCELHFVLTSAKTRWGTGATLSELGRQIAMDCRTRRHMESFQDERGLVSLAASPSNQPFIDMVPMHHNECANEGGYLPFDPASDLGRAFDDDFRVDVRRYPVQLQRLKDRKPCPLRPGESNHIRTLALGRSHDPDLLFKVYATTLGQASTNRSLRDRLRFICAYEAMKAPVGSGQHTHIQTHFGSALHYSEHIRDPKASGDLLALLLLVHFHNRPLNLYVPWQENPLRITPDRAESEALGCSWEGLKQILTLLHLTPESTVDDVRNEVKKYTSRSRLSLLEQLKQEGSLKEHICLTREVRNTSRYQKMSQVLDSFAKSTPNAHARFDFVSEPLQGQSLKEGADAIVLVGWVQQEGSEKKHLVFMPCSSGTQRRSSRSAGAQHNDDETKLDVELCSTSRESSGIQNSQGVDDQPDNAWTSDVQMSGDAVGADPSAHHDGSEPDDGMDDVTPIASPAVTPRSSPGPQGSSSAGDEYTEATFAASQWRQKGGLVAYPALGLRLDDNEFRKLCSKFAQFSERWVGARAKQKKSYGCIPHTSTEILPYDDAFSHGDDVLGLFDGVGAGGAHAGRFARCLADRTIQAATPVPADHVSLQDSDYNRSKYILDTAHEQTVEALRSYYTPKGTAATAVVLSLIHRQNQHQLHYAVHGDSQWALFREEDEGTAAPWRYKCKFVSKRMHHGEGDDENPAPYQASMDRNSLYDPEMCTGVEAVQNRDIVLLGCDGVFDAFKPWSTKTEDGVDVKQNEDAYAEVLKESLTDFFRVEQVDYEGQTDAFKAQKSFLQVVGEKLFDRIKKADEWPRTDDLTLMLARISVSDHGCVVGRGKIKNFLAPDRRAELLQKIRDGTSEYYSMRL